MWVVLFTLATLGSATPQTGQGDLSRCEAPSNCAGAFPTSVSDDYTSLLQATYSVDRARGRASTPPKQPASKATAAQANTAPAPPSFGAVEVATFQEIAELSQAGDASFQRLSTNLQSTFSGLAKTLQVNPTRLALAIGFFTAICLTFCLACTFRSGTSPRGSKRKCRCLQFLKVKPEKVTRTAHALPAFHPANDSSTIQSYYSRESKLKEAQASEKANAKNIVNPQPQAEQFWGLLEPETRAAQAAVAEAEMNVVLAEYKKQHKELNCLPQELNLQRETLPEQCDLRCLSDPASVLSDIPF